MRFKTLYVLLAVLLTASTLFFACRKTEALEAATKGSCAVSGRILDESGQPVAGAMVRAGDGSAQTDINGSFRLTGIPVSDRALAYVRVEKPGYYPGSRTISTRPGSENTVRIELIPRVVVASFPASSGGTAPLDGGGSVQLPANGFVTAADNRTYTGSVSVSAFTFDPTSARFNDIMPGSLLATRSNNEPSLLQSFSMVAVELTGATGERLQLAAGSVATIRFPIPATLEASAPASIPLWYFDEVAGLWKEEGSAQKQGGYYVGTVHHFSFWNCDLPLEYVNFSTRVLANPPSGATAANSLGTPVPHAQVTLTNLSNNSHAMGFTDQEGYVSGAVPRNVSLRIDVYNYCGTIVYSNTIGPFSNDVSTTTALSAFNSQTITFSGSVADCNGAPLAQGVVSLIINSQVFRTAISNGTYSYTQTGCGGALTANIWAADGAGMQVGSVQAVTGQPGSNTVTNLTACGAPINEFVTWTMNGSTHTMNPMTDSVFIWCYNNPSESRIYAVPQRGAQQYALFLRMSGPQTVGSQLMQELEIVQNSANYMLATPGSIQVSSFGGIGEAVTGTFSATVRDSAQLNTYPVTGSFRLRRGF
ncbi:carboxypeptidase-like regulatory domain-containing protein [Flaviaesturariibacter terrae]